MVATANGKAIQVTKQTFGIVKMTNLTMIGIHGGITVNYMMVIGIVQTTLDKAQIMKTLQT